MQIEFPGLDPVELSDATIEAARASGSAMMDSSELESLAATLLARRWGDQPLVVEIGSHEGRTTVFMASVLAEAGVDATILCIDPFERTEPDELNPRGSYATFLRNVTDAGAEDRCLPLVAFSDQAAAAVRDGIDVLIIDGGHHYPVVSADYRLYGPKVAAGGFVFVDDHHPSYPGVLLATREFLRDHPDFEVLHESYYVVLRRRDDA